MRRSRAVITQSV